METVKMTVNRPALADYPKGWLKKEELPDGWFQLTLSRKQYEAYPGSRYCPFEAKVLDPGRTIEP